MFFQGSLQEGITAALQQSKSVVCFVTDSGTESQQWEDDFLPNSEASPLIGSQAVLLRLEAGSQEEGFLAQLYPIPKKPTIVIIKNGELREYIAAGVTKYDFVRRVKTVLQPTEIPAAMPVQPEQESTRATTESSPANSSSGQATPSSSVSQNQQTRPVPAEQSASNVASDSSTSHSRAEEASKQRHIKETRARNATEPVDSPKKAQSEQQELLKKKQKEAREERQRILKAIEDDKIARHARQAELEAERQAAAAATSDDTTGPTRASPSPAPASKLRSSNGRLSENCAIQVRLLDGSTIRNRFSSTGDTIQSVRKWVDETRTDGNTKYTFKILLTPLPSKTIDATEETQSLRALKLAPSATLILVPAAGKKYTRPASSATAASASTSSSGTTVTNNGPDSSAAQDHPGEEDDNDDLFKRLFAFLMAIFNMISGFFSTLFSTAGPPQPVDQGQRPAQQQQGSSSSSATTTGRASVSGSGSRIKGLERHRQPEKRNETHFYNGNSTNFEPRPDDKDE